MPEFGRAQDSRRYVLDNFVFLPLQLKALVQQVLAADSINADQVAQALRWGVQVRTNMAAATQATRDIIRDEYAGFTDQQLADVMAAISTTWGAVQTWLFANYPRSADGYLEGYQWSAADAEPAPRTVTPLPAPLVTRLEAFRDAFATA